MKNKHDRITYQKLTDSERDKKIESLKSCFEKNDRIRLAYVFGSFIRRNKVRDLDVAIYAAPPLEFDEFLKFGARIEQEIKMPVDLVQIRDLSSAFRYKVIKYGQPIVLKDRKLHNILKAQALSELSSVQIAKRVHSSYKHGKSEQ